MASVVIFITDEGELELMDSQLELNLGLKLELELELRCEIVRAEHLPFLLGVASRFEGVDGVELEVSETDDMVKSPK